MLTLHLIRHAKTHQISPTGNDFDRELMEKGIAQANVIGNYLQTHHIQLGKILCSSAKRTGQTLSIINHQTASLDEIHYSKEYYLCDHRKLLLELAKEHAPIITLIGHNGGISELAQYLTGEYIDLRTCGMITITLPFTSWDMLSESTGSIYFQYRPKVFLP